MLTTLINKVRTLFSKSQDARADNKARAAKIESLFKVGNQGLNKANNQVYVVERTDLGAALLRTNNGELRLVTWATPAETRRLAVVDNWEAVC